MYLCTYGYEEKRKKVNRLKQIPLSPIITKVFNGLTQLNIIQRKRIQNDD